jgi:ankyrin repeat protein
LCPLCRHRIDRVIVDTAIRAALGDAQTQSIGHDSLGLAYDANLPFICDNQTYTATTNGSDRALAKSNAQLAAPKLALAVENNDETEVKRLVHDEGADPSLAPIEEGVTDPPLIRAVSKCNLSMARTLLDLGSDPNFQDLTGRSALLLASASGFSRFVIELIQRNANVFSPDLSGSTVLTAGVGVLEAQAVSAIVQSKHGGREVLNFPDGNGLMPLILACDAARVPVIKVLLNAGANVNQRTRERKERTPLLAAASKCPADVVEELLRRGARADVVDTDGVSPLLEATKRGSERSVKVLIDHGADVNRRTISGDSPASIASTNPTSPMIKQFLGVTS